MKKKVENGATLYQSKFTVNFSSIYVSENMSGKMSGVPSISTAVSCNPICKARAQDPESICSKCFAMNTVARYSALREHLIDNFNLLTGSVLDLDALPIFGNVKAVRLESFGDLANTTQAINYINIAKVNPGVVFTIWTKNPAFLDRAIKECGKPANMICILSSEKINVIRDASAYSWIDHVFTVYSPDYIDANGVEINCGARSCITCMKCYTIGNGVFQISEKLK